MYSPVKGIVLSRIKYSESSFIIKIYTLEYGVISIIQKGIHAKKSRKAHFFLPLQLIEFQMNYQEKKNLQYIKDLEHWELLKGLNNNILKSTLSIFVAEILHKTIREPDPNEELYNFLVNTILYLDQTDNNLANFHITFLIQYAAIMGFEIERPQNSNLYFNLETGIFSNEPSHSQFITQELSKILIQFLEKDYNSTHSIKLHKKDRAELLSALLEYYYLHYDGMQKIKSKEVLEQIFS